MYLQVASCGVGREPRSAQPTVRFRVPGAGPRDRPVAPLFWGHPATTVAVWMDSRVPRLCGSKQILLWSTRTRRLPCPLPCVRKSQF